MKPPKSDVIAQILALPQTFHSVGNISMYSLLEGTGYFALHDQVGEDDIRAALLHCPEFIQEWMQYAEDKRTSSGWYVTQNEEECYEIGYITSVQNRISRVQYENATEACAAFIKHEIESIRSGK